MGSLRLPAEFQQSYRDRLSYPLNLGATGTRVYPWKLQEHFSRLDRRKASLCLPCGANVEVPIRDFVAGPKDSIAVNKCNIHTAEKLTQWLGVEVDSQPNEKDGDEGDIRATTRDPVCRFVYLYGDHSRSHLKISHDMLTQILTYHQVMPSYLDFMTVFGSQVDSREIRFSGFRSQLTIHPGGSSMPALGRSGRQIQLCYNLVGVSDPRQDVGIKFGGWSIRQAAIHHQFDIVYGTTIWIVTKGRLDMHQRYKALTGPDGRPEDKAFGNVLECFRSALAAHLVYCHWATEDWHQYIGSLEEVLETKSRLVVYDTWAYDTLGQEDLTQQSQELQHWKDKSSEVIQLLEANINVMTALQDFYGGLMSNEHFPTALGVSCQSHIDSFRSEVGGIADGLRMQMGRVRLLVDIVGDRKQLIAQRLQWQTMERTQRLNANMEKEAIRMRIITIVTLVYLPATFVSTFFSTDVVKYQNTGGAGGNSESFSSLALARWLEITLPLTALTLSMAWLIYKMAEDHSQTFKLAPIAQFSGKMPEASPFSKLRGLWRDRSASLGSRFGSGV